ncbi:hypothetical protein [Acetatifactor aquisgranensis]|uniref:hypothetical protein n=1 Tax=Acetatifactor aquisgranensis TaxID=2941233 RepID=UPI00203BFC31|nr:hypothetical protein [Acetatifactor aquisgranensis]
MDSMYELSIPKNYPASKYNLMGNTDVMVQVPDIKSPVIQVVRLDTDPQKKDVYIQQKASKEYRDKNGNVHPATPNLYAIAKNGLKKLADGAGIKMVSSEHVIPTTCQKCVAVNQHSGKVVQCGSCRNKDVAFRITISVPQLTGEVLMVEDTHEIIVDNVVPGMSDKQRTEFMKHLPQICEAKALNGAIRTALHIKGTYTLEEISKPFVVAYLVPNLNHEAVKQAAIESMFQSSQRLFGNIPSIHQVEAKVPESASIEASDGEEYEEYVDGTYREAPGAEEPIQEQEDRTMDFRCDKCNEVIPKKVWEYSIEHYDRPLCYKCQKIVRGEQRGGRRQ